MRKFSISQDKRVNPNGAFNPLTSSIALAEKGDVNSGGEENLSSCSCTYRLTSRLAAYLVNGHCSGGISLVKSAWKEPTTRKTRSYFLAEIEGS